MARKALSQPLPLVGGEMFRRDAGIGGHGGAFGSTESRWHKARAVGQRKNSGCPSPVMQLGSAFIGFNGRKFNPSADALMDPETSSG